MFSKRLMCKTQQQARQRVERRARQVYLIERDRSTRASTHRHTHKAITVRGECKRQKGTALRTGENCAVSRVPLDQQAGDVPATRSSLHPAVELCLQTAAGLWVGEQATWGAPAADGPPWGAGVKQRPSWTRSPRASCIGHVFTHLLLTAALDGEGSFYTNPHFTVEKNEAPRG